MTRACIQGKIESGVIDEKNGQEALDMLDELEQSYRESLSPEMAAIKAGEDLAAALKQKAAVVKKQNYLQIKTVDRLDRQVHSHSGGVIAGGQALLDLDLSRNMLDQKNVVTQRSAVLKQVSSMFFDGLNKLQPTGLGFKRARAEGEDILHALFGSDKASKSAQEIAQSFSQVSEFLRARFNAAGGNIGKLESWLLPQSHDMRKIGEVTVGDWKDYIRPLLARDKMIDLDTGKPMSDAKLELVLHDVYETLRTDGINKLKVGGQGQGRKLANRHSDPRVLHFKDADSWLGYHERFGSGDVFNTLTGHMERMAHDIAMMEVWGPNPELSKKYVTGWAKKEAAETKPGKKHWSQLQLAALKIKAFETQWNNVTGLTSTPVHGRMATVGSELRAWQTASKLGSAFISAFSDFWTAGMVAKMNKMDASRVMGEYLQLLKSEDHRELAAQIGVVADSLTQTMASGHRYAGEMLSHGFMARVAEGVMRASLLKPHTDLIQMSFQMEFLGMLGRHSDKAFDQLGKGMRANLEKYGIGEAQWSLIRKGVREHKGARYIDVMAIARMDVPQASDVAEQLQRMMLSEREYAVITSHSRVKSFMYGDSQPGTLMGEARRFFWQFKNFPLTFAAMHLSRAMAQSNIGTKIGYATGMAAGMTVFGMISLQAHQIKDGKDLRDLSSVETWKEAMWQGGGLGIMGDFISGDANRYGGSLLGTMAGPIVGQTGDAAWKLLMGNAQQAASGEETNLGVEMMRFADGNIPFQNLWYLKTLVERNFTDRINEFIDPNYHRRKNRILRKKRKERGQDFYWPPGESLPKRAPDMKDRD